MIQLPFSLEEEEQLVSSPPGLLLEWEIGSQPTSCELVWDSSCMEKRENGTFAEKGGSDGIIAAILSQCSPIVWFRR